MSKREIPATGPNVSSVRDEHVGRDALEHGGRVERAVRVLALGQALAAGDEAGATADRVLHVLLGLVDRALVDERADRDALLVPGRPTIIFVTLAASRRTSSS